MKGYRLGVDLHLAMKQEQVTFEAAKVLSCNGIRTVDKLLSSGSNHFLSDIHLMISAETVAIPSCFRGVYLVGMNHKVKFYRLSFAHLLERHHQTKLQLYVDLLHCDRISIDLRKKLEYQLF